MVAFPSHDAMRLFHETRVGAMRRADDEVSDVPTCRTMNGREAVENMLGHMRAQVQQLQQLQADSRDARQLIGEAEALEEKVGQNTLHSEDFILAGEIAQLTRRLSNLLATDNLVAL